MKKTLILLIILITGCQNQTGQQKVTAPIETDELAISLSEPDVIEQGPWQFIKNESQITIPDNQRIIKERQQMLTHKVYFERTATRAEPYMYYIISQLHQRNMPVELALLPLIESAYNPLATSSAKAAGLWQIVPVTASTYGMTQNKWYDPRRDLVESTNGALNYLQYLNARFKGDWLLTLAAYNAGEGRVRRAQIWNESKGLPTHYWALNLPKETMRYVPKMLATIDVVKHSQQYAVKLPDCDFNNALVKVDIGQQIKLERVANIVELPLEEVSAFNAAHLRKTVNGPYYLLIPNSYAELLYDKLVGENFAQAEIVNITQSVPEENRYQSYEVQTTNQKYSQITDKDLQRFALEHRRHSQIIYRVKSGDNLSLIAKNHRVKVSEIIKWNNLKNADRLRPGDRLTINIRNGSAT